MTRIIFLTFLFFTIINVAGQNFNVILQVNDQNINGQIANIYLSNNSQKNDERISVNYYPGDLIIPDYEKLNFKNLNEKFYLNFDYYTYKKEMPEIKRFKIELTEKILKNPYLIINIYDFRNRKYKKWFQYLTKEDYLVQLTYPNSGLWIRQR